MKEPKSSFADSNSFRCASNQGLLLFFLRSFRNFNVEGCNIHLNWAFNLSKFFIAGLKPILFLLIYPMLKQGVRNSGFIPDCQIMATVPALRPRGKKHF